MGPIRKQLLFVGLAAVLLCMGVSLPVRAADLAIVGGRVYPSPEARPIDRATVLVRDGRIVAVGRSGQVKVPRGVPVVNAAGAVVVAGFWNSHVHMLEVPLREAATRPAAELSQALEATFTRWGFTTVFDIGSIPGNSLALRRRVEAGEVTGPLVLTTDGPFFPKDGTPIYVRELFRQIQAPNMEVATVEQGQARAQQQLDAGADGVKLFAGAIIGGPDGVLPMDTNIASAIAQVAHRAKKPVFAHPTNAQGLEVSIASGVDVLAHTTPTGGAWSPEFAARLVSAGMSLTPTLSLFAEGLKQEGASPEVIQRFVQASQQQVAAFVKAGGQPLFGTDVGYLDLTDTRHEFELMAGAGMSWRQILASLTTHPANRFGHGERLGRLAPGMQADVVVLWRDPAKDVAAFADVRYTIRGGQVIYASPKRPARR